MGTPITEQEYNEAFIYVVSHKPTVRELRGLVKNTLLTWPLVLLNAFMDAGIDIDEDADCRVVHRVIESDDLVDSTFSVLKKKETKCPKST